MYSSEEKRSLSFGMGGEDKFFVSSSSSKDGDDEFAFPERDSDEENYEKEEGEKTRVMKTRFSKEEEEEEDEEREGDDSEDDSSVSEEELEEYEKLDDTLNTDSKGGGQSGDFVRSSSSSDSNEEHDKEYYPNSGPKTKDEHERQTKLRLMIIRQRDKEFKSDQKFKSKSIVALNNEAVEALKKDDDIEAIAKYAKVFRKAHENNLTHELMHVCHSNLHGVTRIVRWRI